VLIVEDDAILQRVMRAALEGVGLRVELAATGHAALEIARRQPPRLVLLDWLLPDMVGSNVAAELRAGCGAECPIVFVSAAPSLRQKAAACGANAYLAKPFDLYALLDVVERLTGHSADQ
jgi:CheY-like chemotaxis protein